MVQGRVRVELLVALTMVALAAGQDGPFFAGGRWAAVQRMALSADGSRLVYTSAGRFSVVSTADGREIFGLAGKSALAISPDGNSLVVPGDRKVQILRAADGKPIRTISLPDYFQITAAQFSRDGKTLAVAGGTLYHMNVSLWEVPSGRRLSEPLHDVDGATRGLAFSPDGKYLAVEHGLQAYVIDTVAGKKINQTREQSDLLWFNDEGGLLRLRSGTVTAVPVREGEAVSQRATLVHDPAVAFGSARPVVVGLTGLIAVPIGESVSLRDLGGREHRVLDGAHRSRVTAMAFSANGKLAAVGRENGTFDLWRL